MTTDKTRSAKGKKLSGYWDDPANVIAEARAVVEEHGPEALKQKWLNVNGRSSLAYAISKHGGFSLIRAELGLEQGIKPRGYWSDSANVIAEAKAIVSKCGFEALDQGWLRANGHNSLPTAIARHGGYVWLRKELAIEQGKKPKGYWEDPPNVIAEAKAIVEEHGPEALNSGWLIANDHGGLVNAISRNGGFTWIRAELGLEQGQKPMGYWNDPANVIAEAKAIVEEHDPEALNQSWLADHDHSSLAYAISKHGGMAWVRAEVGLEQGKKPAGYWEDSANVIAEAKAIAEEHGPDVLTSAWLQTNGHSGMRSALSKHGGIAWLRAELGIEAPARPNFSDSVQHALDCTGNHTEVRDSDFYIYDLRNFTGFIKPGIAFDAADRAYKSEGQYGEELYCKTLDTRQEAYFLEQAILDATRGCAGYPGALAGWAGATEVRAMQFEDLEAIADRLLAELEELGVWEFAARFVPMTAAQRAICQQRALTGAPACVETAAL